MSKLHGAIGILALWIISVVTAFWVLEGQYMRPVPRPASMRTQPNILILPVQIQTDQGIINVGAHEPVTVLNFWNPDCGCSRYNEAHVRRLVQTYAAKGVRFVTVIVTSEPQDSNAVLTTWRSRNMPSMPVVVDTRNTIAREFGVWAAPAAVILNTHGKVTYVGAYNAARYCDARKSAWAQKALDTTLIGANAAHTRTPFFGCQLLK